MVRDQIYFVILDWKNDVYHQSKSKTIMLVYNSTFLSIFLEKCPILHKVEGFMLTLMEKRYLSSRCLRPGMGLNGCQRKATWVHEREENS